MPAKKVKYRAAVFHDGHRVADKGVQGCVESFHIAENLLEYKVFRCENGFMPELLGYAREKGVNPLLWYSSSGHWNDIVQSPTNKMDRPIVRKKEMQWLFSDAKTASLPTWLGYMRSQPRGRVQPWKITSIP